MIQIVSKGSIHLNGEEPGARVAAYTLDTAATLFVARQTVTPEEGLRLERD